MKLDDLWCNLRHFPTISIHKVAVFTIFVLDFMKSAELQAMETNYMCLLFLVGGWGQPLFVATSPLPFIGSNCISSNWLIIRYCMIYIETLCSFHLLNVTFMLIVRICVNPGYLTTSLHNLSFVKSRFRQLCRFWFTGLYRGLT